MSAKIIKRYANRKLYDTERSRYVTLEEIGEMVKVGEDLTIVDNRTGEDLTNVTLTQIIYEDQKRPDPDTGIPLNVLRGIIQSGGEFLTKLSNPVANVGADIKRRAGKLEENSQSAVRDFVESTQRRLDETQRRIDENVKSTIDQMTHIPTLASELQEMRQRMARMEKKIIGLQRTVDELREHQEHAGHRDSIPSQKSNPTRAL